MTNEIKLVCFDLDDTLIKQNSWERLNAALGITDEEDQALYRQYKNGEITYAQWQEKLEALYAERGQVSEAVVNEVLTTFTFNAGAETLIQHLQAKGYELAVVSRSFATLVEAVAKTLGITHFYGAEKLELTGDSARPLKIIHQGDQDQAKLAYVEQLCAELGIDITQCACIADGANDRPLFAATGKGITFVDSPVADIAWQTIEKLSDVEEIL